MAEPESWEDMESSASAPTKTTPAPSLSAPRVLNPNAPSFSFNPSAAPFTPVTPPAPPPTPAIPLQLDTPELPLANLLSAGGTTSIGPVLIDPPVAVALPPADSGSAQSDASGFEGSEYMSETATLEVEQISPKHHHREEDGHVDTKLEVAANGRSSDEADKATESVASLKLSGKNFRQDQHKAMEIHVDHVNPIFVDHGEEELDKRLHLNVVFIGHVDAGKSTIGGQILYLSKMVDERTIQKYEREAKEKNRDSWYMAYIMDTNEEERAKGKTVEVGRAHFETEKTRFTILDAPGHKNYVPNMISGASQADIGVLVISARKGEFETGFERGGQTREHAQLAKTLGVSKLLVVVNKMDEPSVQWSKERFDEIEKKLVPFLRSCGYNVKKDVQFLPISGLFGTNMMERMAKSVCPWWNGPSLFEALDAIELPPRDSQGPFRMPLIDRFKDMGTVVMGKIESGSVRRGDNLIVMPNKAHVKVVTVYRDNDEVNLAKPGENLRIRLSGVEEEDILSGFVLSSIYRPISAVREFNAQLQILELLDHKAIFTAGYKAVLHIHAVVEECEIIELLQQIDPKTKKPMKKKVLFVKNGAVVLARIQVNDTICVERFEDLPQLGRFTLRDEGKTVAIGKVVSLPAASSQE